MSTGAAAAAPWLFVVLWSTGFVVARYGTKDAGPLTFLAIRLAIAALVLGGIAAATGSERPTRRQAVAAGVSGLGMHAVYLGGVFLAISWGMPSGIGALIAMRRSLWEAVPDDVCNDLQIPLRLVAQGHQVVTAQDVECLLGPSKSLGKEMARRTRIISRSIRPATWALGQYLKRGRLAALFFLLPGASRLSILFFFGMQLLFLIGPRLILRLALTVLHLPHYMQRRVLILGAGEIARDGENARLRRRSPDRGASGLQV